jgi:hypothetical protein
MRGAIPPLPQYVFMASCSVKAQEQLYLHIYRRISLDILRKTTKTPVSIVSSQSIFEADTPVTACGAMHSPCENPFGNSL